jgi:uncharacterized delta-60 repeat protein
MKTLMGFVLGLLPLAIFSYAAQAEVWEEWVSRFDGYGHNADQAYCIALAPDGNVVVAGSSEPGRHNEFDYYATLKYDPQGECLWDAYSTGIPHTGNDPKALAVDAEGNVFVAGTSPNALTSSWPYDYLIIKYDSAGNQAFMARYDGILNGNDEESAMAVDLQGNVYVTGRSQAQNGLFDYATVKVDPEGNIAWIALYDGFDYNDEAYDIAADAFANVYVTGYSGAPGTDNDFVTVKYDSSGAEQWIARYDGSGHDADFGEELTLDEAGNVYVTGSTDGSATSIDIATVKYNSLGQEEWRATYTGLGNFEDRPADIQVDALGQVYVGGYSTTGHESGRDFVIIKYSALGDMLWIATYNGPGSGEDESSGLTLDSTGNVYITGRSYGGSSNMDYATIKYNPSGQQEWVMRFSGPDDGWDMASAISVDGSENVYVTGYVAWRRTGWDMVTIKYSQETDLNASEQSVINAASNARLMDDNPCSFDVERPHPNPFNANTTISYQLPADSHVSLRIYDTAGREVQTLTEGWRPAGAHRITFDGTGIPSGIYLCRLTAGEFTATQKMVLMK